MHTLICGVTETGKTTLAQCLAQADREGKEKLPVLVYDPVDTDTLAGGWPNGTIFFDDKNKFLKYLAKFRDAKCSVYIDESADLLGQQDKHNFWILTRGRHYGFNVVLLAQRPKMLAPSVRHQCTRLIMFRVSIDDARIVGQDFGHSDFHTMDLDRGDFICAYSGHSTYTRGNVFVLAKRRGELLRVLAPPLDKESKWIHTSGKAPSSPSS